MHIRLNFCCVIGLCFLDVSGGPTPSIIRTMKAALDTSIHLSYMKDKYIPLNYQEVFYLATLGGAEGNKIGIVSL